MWKEIDFEIRGRESFGASVTSQRLEPLVVRIRLALHKHRWPDGSVVNRRPGSAAGCPAAPPQNLSITHNSPYPKRSASRQLDPSVASSPSTT
jgi:hypothetical protein